MRFTHLDRVYWTELHATKLDLAEYHRERDYAFVDNVTSLLWTVELGAVDLHVWPSCFRTPSFVRISRGDRLPVLVPIARGETHAQAARARSSSCHAAARSPGRSSTRASTPRRPP